MGLWFGLGDIHTCMYVCMYIYIYTCINVCVCVYVYLMVACVVYAEMRKGYDSLQEAKLERFQIWTLGAPGTCVVYSWALSLEWSGTFSRPKNLWELDT